VAVKLPNLTSSLQQRILTGLKLSKSRNRLCGCEVDSNFVATLLICLMGFGAPFLLPGGGLDCCWQLLLF